MTSHPSGDLEGRYIYCVVDDAYPKATKRAGIEGRTVYGIPYKDIRAIVHKCSSKPYESKNSEQVRKWIFAHHHVVKLYMMKLGTVVPVAFDIIIRGGDEGVKKWLRDDYERLKEKLRRLHRRAEYGVQIFWKPEIITRKLMTQNGRIMELHLQQKKSFKGMAYILEKKVERELASELQKEAEQRFREFYSRIAKTVEAIHVNLVKQAQGERMLMNLSVLVANEEHSLLGKTLAEIKEMEGFKVHFTGPWPPYSFV